MQKALNKLFLLTTLFISILLCAGSCAGSKEMSYEQAKKLAKQDTTKLQVPITTVTPADSTAMNIVPDEMEHDMPVEKKTENGLSLSATKRRDGSLDLKAKQEPIIIRDTVEVPVITNVFKECEIDHHITLEQANRKTEEEVARRLKEEREKSSGSLKEGLTDVLLGVAWAVAGLLFLFLLIVLFHIYKAFK